MTCCIRESRESSGRSDSLYLSGVPSAILAHAVRLRQSASGTEPAFWSAGSGTAYLPTVELTACRFRFGSPTLSSEPVFVSDQVRSSVELPLPFASAAALVLRKYAVPLALVSKSPVVGDWAGQIVNPGLPFGSARPVSTWVTVTEVAPDASWAFDITSMWVIVHEPSGLEVSLTATSIVFVPAATGLPSASES